MILSDDQFARLVAEDVKNRVSVAQRDFLSLPDNWERHQRALLELVRNLDGQLAELDERERVECERLRLLGETALPLLVQLQADLAERRAKVSRFHFHVNRRLDEVTRQIALGSDVVEERVQLVTFLRRAIERHRELVEQANLDPTTIDKALWVALDGQWLFDDVDVANID